MTAAEKEAKKAKDAAAKEEKAAKEARENPTVDENGEHIMTVAEARPRLPSFRIPSSQERLPLRRKSELNKNRWPMSQLLQQSQ